MNILYHHRTRGIGAEGAHIMGIVEAMRSKGFNVTILSVPGADPERNMSGRLESAGKRSFVSSCVILMSRLTKYLPEFFFEILEIAYNVTVFVRFKNMVGKKAVNVIYERYSLFMFAGVWFARKNNVKILLEINDSVLVQRVRPLMFRRLAFRIEKWIFKNCDGLIFISTYFKNIAENNYGEISKSVVCPNGVDLRRFSPELYDRDKIRGEFGVRGKIVCGYVGAFVHWHGIDWFVSEVALRLKDVPNLVLLLVGDGVCYESIRDVIKKYDIENQVIMTGRVMHRDVPRIMSAMDFGILPDSNEYGSPMKLLEFMAMGLGVVSPSYEPIKEVVNNNITGWLFEPGDRSAGIGKVMEIAMNADERKKVGLNACEFIRTSRQWSNNVELALSLLQDPSIC